MFAVKSSELKSSWPPEPIGHGKSWRTNRNTSHLPRPPPGLTSQKQSWSGEGPQMPRVWGGETGSQESPFKPGKNNKTLSAAYMNNRNTRDSYCLSVCVQSGATAEQENPGCYCVTSRHRYTHKRTSVHRCDETNRGFDEFMFTDRWLDAKDHLSTTRPSADLSPRPDTGNCSDSLQQPS